MQLGNDATLAFDLSGHKAFGSSAFTVVLDNVYTQSTDITLRILQVTAVASLTLIGVLLFEGLLWNPSRSAGRHYPKGRPSV